MSTAENLKEAFAGESQANRRYLAFARQADTDGLPHVARLFRAVAEAETVHALSHLRAAGGVKTTAENLQAAAEGEAYEFKSMYPPFVAQAKADGHKAAEKSFAWAMAVEKVHHGLYNRAAEAVKAGGDLPDVAIHVCPVCGNTFLGDLPDACPVCGAPSAKFLEVI